MVMSAVALVAAHCVTLNTIYRNLFYEYLCININKYYWSGTCMDSRPFYYHGKPFKVFIFIETDNGYFGSVCEFNWPYHLNSKFECSKKGLNLSQHEYHLDKIFCSNLSQFFQKEFLLLFNDLEIFQEKNLKIVCITRFNWI